MSEKSLDNAGRWRNRVVAFRVSEKEAEMINRLVSASGMSKQDYIMTRLTNKELVVEGSIRTFSGLKTQLMYVQEELKRINEINIENQDVIDLLKVITDILLKIEENQNLLEKRRMKIYRKRGGWNNV